MTKEQLTQANTINEQIETLTKFLDENQKCWGILRFFVAPKQTDKQVTLRTSYGWRNEEITASKRLSATIIEAIKQEVSLLQSELDNIGKDG